jgi:hypothetical protein
MPLSDVMFHPATAHVCNGVKSPPNMRMQYFEYSESYILHTDQNSFNTKFVVFAQFIGNQVIAHPFNITFRMRQHSRAN